MPPAFIAVIAIVAVTALWVSLTQHKLMGLEEKTNNAMNQIGVEISISFDALNTLLDLTKNYAMHDSITLIENILSRRTLISAKSKPEEVILQEWMISEALDRISMVAEQYPQLKASPTYMKDMETAQRFREKTHTFHLIYNDGVNQLNRKIRSFPTSLVAGMLGFYQKEYLVEPDIKTAALIVK